MNIFSSRLRSPVAVALLSLVSIACEASVVEQAAPDGLATFKDEAELTAFAGRLQALQEARQKEASLPRITGTTVPGAVVVVESLDGKFRREVVAAADGFYAFIGLPVGKFKVTAAGQTLQIDTAKKYSSASLEKVTVYGTQEINTIDVASVESSTILTSEQITNVQTAGVDEGGIVKKAGEFLVVLRRGHLFTIRVNSKTFRTVSSVDAFGPDVSPQGTWYDEMLVSGDTIVVIGYSYKRGGTEVGLFDLSKDGRITYRATYQLRGNDYYSSRNYASRLIGKTLIFYSPIDFYAWRTGGLMFPGFRRWTGTANDSQFKRIVPAERIYRSGVAEDEPFQTLHTVTRCDLSRSEPDCQATGVLGPRGSAFYVSNNAMYVWMATDRYAPRWETPSPRQASVVRMPLDGSAPSQLRVDGSPIDQMSFLESEGFLNVLVGAKASGTRMWSSGSDSGKLALLRVPVARFGSADAKTGANDYRPLPSPGGDEGDWYMHNRYVGSWLLYGSAREGRTTAYALRIEGSEPPTELSMQQPAERIEAMGRNAVIVGSANGDLHMNSISLGESANVAGSFVVPKAAQGDSRTHGFYYRALSDEKGLFGLPVILKDGRKASVQFIRTDKLRLQGAGGLDSRSEPNEDDADCVASCVDWYGDARPIFIGKKVYGLLGYELVEGKLQGAQVRELRRLNFTPLKKPEAVAQGPH